MLVLDLVQIPRVVVGDMDGVMWQIERSLDAEIHHERRAGEFLARDLAIGPATAQAVGHEPLHGAGEVGVHDNRVGPMHDLARCARRRRGGRRTAFPQQADRARISTPRRSATRAIAAVTAAQPPIG